MFVKLQPTQYIPAIESIYYTGRVAHANLGTLRYMFVKLSPTQIYFSNQGLPALFLWKTEIGNKISGRFSEKHKKKVLETAKETVIVSLTNEMSGT